MTQSIWTILGLRATRDIGEIKRAYAAKLKAIDMDADPGAFQTLREAKDIAIRLAEQPFDDDPFEGHGGGESVDAPEQGEPAEPGVDDVERDRELAPETEASAEATEPQDPVEQELSQNHQALCTILFDIHDGNFRAASPEEEQAMLRHFEAIAASPKLHNVDTLSNASHWFAGAIAQMTPRSDVLIEPAARLFGWDQSDELAEDPALAAVMQRRADLRFLDEISQPSHRLHAAWTELTKPADENSKRGWHRRKKIMELLGKVRSEHPTLERQMDWYRVNLWENTSSMTEARNFGPALIVIFLLIKFCVAAYESDTAPDPAIPAYEQPATPRVSLPLTTAEQDIDKAIRTFTDDRVTGDLLRKENAGLYELAHGHWQLVQTDRGNLSDFNSRFRGLIDDRVPDVWAYANGDLLAERLELERDIAKSLAAVSANACVRHFRDGASQVHQVHRQRGADIKAKAILALDAERPLNHNPDTRISFRIPSEVTEEIRRRAGLDAESFNRAWKFEGEDELAQCKVQLALQDAILELPPATRTKIIRDMMS